MRFVSFFAGVGGMDFGLERAGWECVGQVEINPYCRAVLAKHWPDVKRMEDVRDVKGDEFGEFDWLVGGFPCQDVSNAGLRAGISAPRSGLYGEIVRCLRVVRPIGALLENVAALLARGMGRVLGDLAEIGYDTEWDCIPACSVGAPHCRGRVFIVATNTHEERCLRIRPTPCETWKDSRGQLERLLQRESRMGVPAGSHNRMADGLPCRVDRIGALGNAVVPQVAEVIGRSIMEGRR